MLVLHTSHPTLNHCAFANKQMKRLLFYKKKKDTSSYRNRADVLLNLSKTATIKKNHLDSTACHRLGAPARRARASVAPAAIPPDTDCAAAIQSHQNNTEKVHRFRRRSKNARTRTGEQDCSKKQVNFRNPTGCPYYLAASGDVGGLIIGIGDIALAGEKHLSVAVSASMAAGRTGGVKLLAVERRRRRRRTKRRCDCVFLRFLSCLSPFPPCGKINRGGFQRNRAYEMPENGRFLRGFLRLA